MAKTSKNTGVMLTLAKRFQEQRLPRALALKEKVDRGETLSTNDVEFLEQVFKDANYIWPLAEKNPEWQPMVSQAVSLYREILDRATENENGEKS